MPFSVRLVSYNVLSSSLATKDAFPFVDDQYLAANYRWNLVRAKVRRTGDAAGGLGARCVAPAPPPDPC